MNKKNLQVDNLIIDKNNKENIYFEIIYKPNNYSNYKTKIFDHNFINKNKDKCEIIYENKEHELKEYFEDIDNNYKSNDKVLFILSINKNITDISCMFYCCNSLLSIIDIQSINDFNNKPLIFTDIKDEINLSNENNQNDGILNQNEKNEFYKYFEDIQLASSISTIRNKNISNNFLTNNIYDKDNFISSSIFYNFYDISNMSHMFEKCESLISLPDISKWNTSKVTNMYHMIYGFINCMNIISKFIK